MRLARAAVVFAVFLGSQAVVAADIADVWIETENGEKTIQGTASGLVPAVAQLAPSGADDGHGS